MKKKDGGARMREGYIPVPGGNVWFQEFSDGRETRQTPLLVLHGGPGATHDYLKVLSRLAPRRPVIFYEQLGSLKSPVKDKDQRLWTLERFVRELESLADGLRLKTFDLLGHSWGGALAVEYALSHPERVRRLVLASPLLSTPLWKAHSQRLLNEVPEDARRIILEHERAGTIAAPKYQDAAMAFYRRFVCRMPQWPAELGFSFEHLNWDVYRVMWGPSEFTVTGSLAKFDRMGDLSALTSPVLITGGRFDEAGAWILELAAKELRAGRLEIFERSAHVAHLEETERYLNATDDFLKE
ncbi:MAG TPA: proline iminopeptidase-family hydrolase [Elusimicrobiota bacterium]|nr:proline iminopeptidase-family hydrolase [Elusimicrobiota bacterium]